MKNFKRKLSFLLAAIPMLSNGVASAQNPESPERNQGPVKMEDKLSEQSSSNNEGNLSEYLPENLSNSERKIRAVIASNIMERISNIRNTALELIAEMTEENFTTNVGSEFTDMLSSVEKVQAETDNLAVYMKDINRSLSGSSRKVIDELLTGLESKVLAFDTLLSDIKNRSWPELKDGITKYNSQIVKTNSLKKKALVKGCKMQSQRIRQLMNNLDSSLQSAINTDPNMGPMYSHIQESAKEIVNNLDRFDSQLVSTQSITVNALQSMKENAQLWESRADKLLKEFNKIQEKANSDSYANVLTFLETKIVKTEMSCDNRTRMNISRRVMTEAQRNSLLQVKDELAKLFTNAKKEIQNVRSEANNSRSLSKAIPNSIRQKLEDLVGDTIGEAADHMRTWGRTVAAIEADDEMRSQWNPDEMHRIVVNRMTKRCYEILTNKSWNIEKKTNGIVDEINHVQSGTGTMVRPVVRGILEYLTKGTPLTSLGEAVAGNLSGRSWLFSGEGGTGKTSAVELLAAAFNVKLIKLTGSQLRNVGEMERIFREIRSLTQPQFDVKNVVNFMVLIDEVDTGVCVATDAAGKSVELEDSSPTRDARSATDESYLKRTTTKAKWQLKTRKTVPDSINVDKEKGASKSSSQSSFSFKRHQQAFAALSKLQLMLDSNPLSNMFAMISTTNASRNSMPEEVARRLCTRFHEVAFRKPIKSEFINIISNSMPNLSFSDGYDKMEGASKIAEQAEKYGMNAAGLVATITSIANAVRKPEDTFCSLPAGALCKLISGSITEARVIEEARQLNYEESKKTSNPSNPNAPDDMDAYDEENSKPYESGLGSFAPTVRLAPPRE